MIKMLKNLIEKYYEWLYSKCKTDGEFYFGCFFTGVILGCFTGMVSLIYNSILPCIFIVLILILVLLEF